MKTYLIDNSFNVDNTLFDKMVDKVFDNLKSISNSTLPIDNNILYGCVINSICEFLPIDIHKKVRISLADFKSNSVKGVDYLFGDICSQVLKLNKES